MAFEPLRTDYKDAVWAGLRKYLMLKNEDDTVSLKDVTQYTVYDDAFFGAEDANRINAAINAIMASVEKGTDLYEAFTAFFENQKKAFTAEADKQNEDFGKYLDGLEQTADADIAKMKDDYTAEIKNFENTQEAVYNTWFDHIKDQLSDDAAGNLQAQIDNDVFKSYRGILENIDTAPKDVKSGCYAVFSSGVIYDLLLCFNSKKGSATALQVLFSFDLKKCKIRPAINNGSWGPWRPLAFADDMAAQLTPMQETLAAHDELVREHETTLKHISPRILHDFNFDCKSQIRDMIQSEISGSKRYLAVTWDSGAIWQNTGYGTYMTRYNVKPLESGKMPALLKNIVAWPENNIVIASYTEDRDLGATFMGMPISFDDGNTWTTSAIYNNEVDKYPFITFPFRYDMDLIAGAPGIIAYNYGRSIEEVVMCASKDTITKEWPKMIWPDGVSGYIDNILYNPDDGYFYAYVYDKNTKTATLLKANTNTWIKVTNPTISGYGYGYEKVTYSGGLYYHLLNDQTLEISSDGYTWKRKITTPTETAHFGVHEGMIYIIDTDKQKWVTFDGKTWDKWGDTTYDIRKIKFFEDTCYGLESDNYHMIKGTMRRANRLDIASRTMTDVAQELWGEPKNTVTIGSVTAADSVTISGDAKKITLLAEKLTAAGGAIYQYINLPAVKGGPKLSALTGTLSTSIGTIAVSGDDILLKSVKGFSITAIIDYNKY